MFNNGFRSNEGCFFPEQPIFTEIVDPEDTKDTEADMINVKSHGIAVAVAAAVYGISKRKEIKDWITDKAVPGIKKALNISGKKEEGSVYDHTSCTRDSEDCNGKTQNKQAKVIDFEAYNEARNRSSAQRAN